MAREISNEENIPLSEYPRPQMKRESYYCLNGKWSLVFVSDSQNLKEYVINVPYSPESVYSGVERTLQAHETMCYKRHVEFPEPVDFEKERLVLHFGAVDYRAIVRINSKIVCDHVGGYLPFSIDLSEKGIFSKDFELSVLVQDPGDSKEISRGKQSSTPGGIWYPKTSGIWQTVWIEKVPKTYIKDFEITPDLQGFFIEVHTNDNSCCFVELSIPSCALSFTFETGTKQRIDIPNPHLWSPEDPFLYDFTLSIKGVKEREFENSCKTAVLKDNVYDKVESYVGLRTFEVGEDDKGNKVLKLNGKPYFHHGLLDQGYYKGGYYTPKSDNDFINDILLAKKLGFNTLRKHIKIEPLRWYYHCDRLGILVWQDMVSGGGKYKIGTITLPLFFGSHIKDNEYEKFARSDIEQREIWEKEAYDTVKHLYNVTSIAMWVPFNEAWGQFDSKRIVSEIEKLDSTRTVDHASGWQDQKIGDFKSLHVYFRPYKFHKDRLGRCVILSEFGGYGYDTNTTAKKSFIYKRLKSKEELTCAIVKLYEKQIMIAKQKGLAGAIYTQLSDVEQETNGLITYDRKEVKVVPNIIFEMSKKLLEEGSAK